MMMLSRAAARSLARRAPSNRSIALKSVIARNGSVIHAGIVKNVEKRTFASMAAGDALQLLADDNPHLEAIRYEYKNVKATYSKVNSWADMLATGLVEQGLIKGDVVLSWLPSHFVEQHVLQFACSKAGFILYTMDPSDTSDVDVESSREALANALTLTKANVLITQEAGQDRNYVKSYVEYVIPETTIFNFGDGMPFFTPRFPHLRFPIHTGFDNRDKAGMLSLRHFLSPVGDLESWVKDNKPTAATPLYGELIVDSKGIPTKLGKIMSNEEVAKANAWPVFSKMLQKEYQEVEGIGNVW